LIPAELLAQFPELLKAENGTVRLISSAPVWFGMNRTGLKSQDTLGGEATEHPIALEQRHGMTMARVKEIAESVYHSSSKVREGRDNGNGLV
jgi:hypothetical protein